MKKIDIPTPCHENWADFTPTQKGAFCSKCQIDVIDFSNKTEREVKEILSEHAGSHLCGRFKKSQIKELNDDFFAWENQSMKSFQSKFLYACLLVFGMSLFSSCNLQNDNIVKNLIPSIGISSEINESNHLLGEIKMVEDDSTNYTHEDSISAIQKDPEESFIKGKVAPQSDIENNCSNENLKDKDGTLNNQLADTLYDDVMIDGEIEISTDYHEYLQDTSKNNPPEENQRLQITDNVSLNQDNSSNASSDKDTFTAKAYPNPSSGYFNVKVSVLQEGSFSIYLYAIDGKQIKHIHNGFLPSGSHQLDIDLSNYPAGKYLLIIQNREQKLNLKLEKI